MQLNNSVCETYCQLPDDGLMTVKESHNPTVKTLQVLGAGSGDEPL